MPRLTASLLSAVLICVHTPVSAQQVAPILTAKDLLLPCQEADNDPRDGFIAQLECVGFIRGFVAGYEQSGGASALCLPETNTDDELRRSFVSWVHKSFSKRSKMPVGEAVLASLETSFACE